MCICNVAPIPCRETWSKALQIIDDGPEVKEPYVQEEGETIICTWYSHQKNFAVFFRIGTEGLELTWWIWFGIPATHFILVCPGPLPIQYEASPHSQTTDGEGSSPERWVWSP